MQLVGKIIRKGKLRFKLPTVSIHETANENSV